MIAQWAEESGIDLEALERDSAVHWYQYQIAAKFTGGLIGRQDDEEEVDQEIPQDSDGSIKVALITMDRSISAWRIMQILLPDRADSIMSLLVALERARPATEPALPNARGFIRPGFDEVLDELVN